MCAGTGARPSEGYRVETGMAPDFEEYYVATEGTKASAEILCREAKSDKGQNLGMDRVNGVRWKCPGEITGCIWKILSV